MTVDGTEAGLVLGALAAVITAMVAWRKFRPDTVAQITATVERALAIANAATERAEKNAGRLEMELQRRHIEVEELRTQLRQGRDAREFLLREITRLEERIQHLEAMLKETRGEARMDAMDRRADRMDERAEASEELSRQEVQRNDDTEDHA